MDASFVPKRPFDSTVDRLEPSSTATANPSSNKRRHHQSPFTTAPPSSTTFRPPPPPLKLAAGEALFRILCPASKTGGVIGKGGAIIRQVREETGARIRIDDSVPGCEERVILIVADSTKKEGTSAGEAKHITDNVDATGEESANSIGEDEGSPAQQALVRVFERILKVDEERSGVSTENDKGEEKREGGNVGGGGSGGATPQGQVVCRLLAPSNQVGSVLGRGGKIVEKIRHDSGAQIRVLPKDQIPGCGLPGDELIQVGEAEDAIQWNMSKSGAFEVESYYDTLVGSKVLAFPWVHIWKYEITGSFSAARKALLSVSSCLQDNPRADGVNSAVTRSSGMALHGTGIENIGVNHRMVMEEEVVFKLLCQVDKVGSLIGKGGSIVRAMQNETGASIKIADAVPDSDERVVVISARENSEQRHSPAQDAVIRVQYRIAEIGFEPGAAVVARLLVHSQQIGCLLGKGGIIISELRRATGASIRIFPKEQVPKYGSQNDEVVQVIGSLQSVQDALLQITSRLRESIFPVKPHIPSVSGSMHLPPYPEMPSPLFRPRHDPASPGHYHSPVGLPHGIERVSIPAQPPDPHHFSHGVDHIGPNYFDRVPYPYGNEKPGHGPPFDRQSSPRGWMPQAVPSGNLRGATDVGGGFALSNGPIGSGSQGPSAASTTVEMVIPQAYLSHVYGENNSNLSQIRQVSGAKVVVHDPRPGASAGMVVISGTQDQIYAAQSFVHGCILAELPC